MTNVKKIGEINTAGNVG